VGVTATTAFIAAAARRISTTVNPALIMTIAAAAPTSAEHGVECVARNDACETWLFGVRVGSAHRGAAVEAAENAGNAGVVMRSGAAGRASGEMQVDANSVMPIEPNGTSRSPLVARPLASASRRADREDREQHADGSFVAMQRSSRSRGCEKRAPASQNHI
jgi:hypothetical protein